MNKMLMAAAAIAVPVGFGFVCPALAEAQRQGSMPPASLVFLLLGLSLMLGGAGTMGYAIKARETGHAAS